MRVAVITDLPRLYEETMYLRVLEKEIEKINIEMKVFIVKTPDWLVLNTKFPAYQVLRTMTSFREICGYDIIHAQFTLPFGLVLASLKKVHGRPVIIHTHGYDVFTIPSEGIGLRRIKVADSLSKISWKAATRVIAVCKRAKNEIVNEGIDEERIDVLYNGVDEELFSRRRRIEDKRLDSLRANNDFIFLSVGNLVKVKNQARLLMAYRSYQENCASIKKTALVLCGVGPLKERLRLLAHRLGVNNSVKFIGQLPHYKMPELYNIANVFVLPSLSEAHPWSLLEAMSCELPAIASNVGGIPETLEDKNLLFDPWIPSDICETMIHLAENPDRRKHIGAKNRKLVLERFTFRDHVANLSSIYDRVCQVA